MLAAADLPVEVRWVSTAAGYQLLVREPGHRCLRAGDPEAPVNLHCYRTGDAEIGRLLAFRDRLRADLGDRARYEAVKRRLATREWRDLNYYAAAKGPVIAEILGRVRPGGHYPHGNEPEGPNDSPGPGGQAGVR